MDDLVQRLRACADDPMWAHHAEVPKTLCARAADEIERLRADAERYRWLRKTTNWASSKGERIYVGGQPDLWDAAIDAAMKGE